MLQKTEIKCPMQGKGCAWKGSLQDFDQHGRECKYVVVELECLMHSAGCEWKGKLEDSEQHEMECEYMVVECQHCSEWVQRNGLHTHAISCRRRLYQCDFCSEKVPYEDIRTLHWPICKKYPEPMKERDQEFCRLRADVDELKAAMKLEAELKEDKFKVALKEKRELEAALKVKDQQITKMQKQLMGKIKQIEEGLRNSQQKQSQLEKRVTNIDQRLTANQNPEIEDLRETVAAIRNQLQHANCQSEDGSSTASVADGACAAGNFAPTFPGAHPVWSDFAININDISKRSHESPAFTTSSGYKMLVDMYYKAGRKELSAHVYVLPGDNDDSLIWPMRADVRIELYDPSDRCRPYMKNVDGKWERALRGRSASQAVDPFITHEELVKFVRDGLLYFRVYGYVS